MKGRGRLSDRCERERERDVLVEAERKREREVREISG